MAPAAVPARAAVPAEVAGLVPELHRRLSLLEGDLARPSTQASILRVLGEYPAWRRWVQALPPLELRPILIGAGLDLARNTGGARRLMVGLASSLVRDGVVPGYQVGGEAVTEVTAQGGSALSHSQNDAPAPPHTAGFFEPVPPMALLFACVRPHPGGGAETTVTDLERLLGVAEARHLRAWQAAAYRYRTSARLGHTTHPLRLLRHVSGRPLLRYRREYMVADVHGDGAEALEALDRLLTDPANTFRFALERDEVLVLWNGAPHGRTAQAGPTPADQGERRLLLRCRVQPRTGWSNVFSEG